MPRNSGLSNLGSMSLTAPAGAAVTLNQMVGIGFRVSKSGQLVFAYNTLVAVQLTLHAVLENAGRFGQQTYDREASLSRNLLVSIG